MTSIFLNVFIAPLKSSFFIIIHFIISVHFKIEPFQKLVKNFFLLPLTFSKSFFCNLTTPF
ncbi:hypothetical protein HPCPY6261_0673 [Helicobacter pylori CPY6261]|nr:hypothetical protein HPCPY6261_0673 [Helicobacter pylori CPY6261]